MSLQYYNGTVFAFYFVHLIKCTLILNFYTQILQYDNQLQALWPPQPTPTWTGAKIHKLSEIQDALALLPKVFRKSPETSKSKVPNIVKSHQNSKHISKNMKKMILIQWRPLTTAGNWDYLVHPITTRWPKALPSLSDNKLVLKWLK